MNNRHDNEGFGGYMGNSGMGGRNYSFGMRVKNIISICVAILVLVTLAVTVTSLFTVLLVVAVLTGAITFVYKKVFKNRKS